LRACAPDAEGEAAFEMASDGARLQVRDLATGQAWEGDASSVPRYDVRRPWRSLRPLDLVDALLPCPLAADRSDGADSGVGVVLERIGGVTSLLWLATDAGGRPLPRRRVWMRDDSPHEVRMLHFDARGEPRLDVRMPSGIDASTRLPAEIVVRHATAGFAYRLEIREATADPDLSRSAFRWEWGDEQPAPLPGAG
jgi:hypothetical protein